MSRVKAKLIAALKAMYEPGDEILIYEEPHQGMTEQAREGARAAEAGGEFADNPYPHGSQHYTDWAWGFHVTHEYLRHLAGVEAPWQDFNAPG